MKIVQVTVHAPLNTLLQSGKLIRGHVQLAAREISGRNFSGYLLLFGLVRLLHQIHRSLCVSQARIGSL
jgi:hypothetical protein